ncbi:MAG: hypothetical protein ACNI27_11050 [Desulfovibrio sp.]
MMGGVDKYKAWGWVAVILGGVFFVICGVCRIYTPLNVSEYGDLLAGLVAPTWALAGVFFLVGTLETQREALAAQRDHAATLEKEQERQRELFERQQFETSFYNLLKQLAVIQSRYDYCDVDPFYEWAAAYIRYGERFARMSEDEKFDCDSDYEDNPYKADNHPEMIENFLKYNISDVIEGIRGGDVSVNADLENMELHFTDLINYIHKYAGKQKDFYYRIAQNALSAEESRFLIYFYQVKGRWKQLEPTGFCLFLRDLYDVSHAEIFPDVWFR